MFTKSLVVTTLVAVASAQLHPIAKREYIEARQTDLSDPACAGILQSLLPIYRDVPTPPAALSTAMPTNACATPTFADKSLETAYSLYSSEVMVWYSSHSAEVLSAISACPALTQYASEVPVCSSITDKAAPSPSMTMTSGGASNATVTGGATATGTHTGDAEASKTASGASSVVTAAAPHETGFVAGIVAAAGFVAVVAAL